MKFFCSSFQLIKIRISHQFCFKLLLPLIFYFFTIILLNLACLAGKQLSAQTLYLLLRFKSLAAIINQLLTISLSFEMKGWS